MRNGIPLIAFQNPVAADVRRRKLPVFSEPRQPRVRASLRRLLLSSLLPAVWLAAVVSLHGAEARFRFTDVNDNSLGLWEGNRPVFVYNHGVMTNANAPADRARSSYVHPLYGLDGEVLTDDFPKDHFHHRGLFWAWPHVRIGDEEFDLWMLKGIRTQFERWLKRDAGKKSAVLGVQNGWFVGDRRVMDEQVWLRVWPATAAGRAADVELTWIPLEKPITLRGAEGKSYGGLTLRYAPFKGETIITTPAGRTKEDLPIARLPWADLSAQFAGAAAVSGAAIFIAPAHPDYPPEWLTRHYGCLCVGWPGVKEQTFLPGKPIHCRYRVWIHRGAPEATNLAQAYQDYTRASSNAPPISMQSGPAEYKPRQ